LTEAQEGGARLDLADHDAAGNRPTLSGVIDIEVKDIEVKPIRHQPSPSAISQAHPPSAVSALSVKD
jgi:hypothetical protein